MSKTLGILVALYLFICSLTFLSTAFRILGGRNLSQLFEQSELLSNPVVGVMIGILVTVAVQSSATSTSIIVALVSAGVEVKHAIPMIFGSNVGTSVTNTIVSMTQAGDRESFRRAFAAATVHDMFNWLSVIVLSTLEVTTGFLEWATGRIVDTMDLDRPQALESAELLETAGLEKEEASSGPDLLKPLTKPFTDLVVQVDKKVLLGWSFHDPKYENVTTLLKGGCHEDGTPCDYLLAWLGQQGLGLSDVALGIVLLAFSLVLLCVCLIALMKILNSMLGTQMAVLIQKTINAEIPYVPWLTGYAAMLLGCVITILVRSSSVFTSTLTPLCGTGLVTLETAYPMTLGSNIGTTTTSILASFAAEGQNLKPSVQIALVHLFFNISGILIFYPIPAMRWPVWLAQRLGDITAAYRWFAVFYLASMFVILPLVVFLLSLAGPPVMYAVLGPTACVLALISAVNAIQAYRSHWLPPFLRNWNYLPLWMRSLQPLDQALSHLACCAKCMNHNDADDEAKEEIDLEGQLNTEMKVLLVTPHDEDTPIIKQQHEGQQTTPKEFLLQPV